MFNFGVIGDEVPDRASTPPAAAPAPNKKHEKGALDALVLKHIA